MEVHLVCIASPPIKYFPCWLSNFLQDTVYDDCHWTKYTITVIYCVYALCGHVVFTLSGFSEEQIHFPSLFTDVYVSIRSSRQERIRKLKEQHVYGRWRPWLHPGGWNCFCVYYTTNVQDRVAVGFQCISCRKAALFNRLINLWSHWRVIKLPGVKCCFKKKSFFLFIRYLTAS